MYKKKREKKKKTQKITELTRKTEIEKTKATSSPVHRLPSLLLQRSARTTRAGRKATELLCFYPRQRPRRARRVELRRPRASASAGAEERSAPATRLGPPHHARVRSRICLGARAHGGRSGGAGAAAAGGAHCRRMEGAGNRRRRWNAGG